jgi:hypothetical protein
MTKPKVVKSTSALDRLIGGRIGEARLVFGVSQALLGEAVGTANAKIRGWQKSRQRGSAVFDLPIASSPNHIHF